MKMLLLFMMLLPYGYGHDRILFEEFNDADVRNPPFPFNYSVTTDSDLLIIRCPGTGFQYTDHQAVFGQSVDASHQDIPILGKNTDKTVLKAVFNNKAESKEFEYSCGTLALPTYFTKVFYWNVKITWNTPPQSPFGAVNRNLDIKGISPPNNCTDIDTISLVKHLSGKVKIEEYKHKETEVFRNDLVYFFDEKLLNTSKSPIMPCGIVQPYIKLPVIIASNDIAIESMDFQTNKIYVIEKNVLEVKLELVVNNTIHSHFYKHDSVTVTSQKLNTERGLEVSNVLKVINNGIFLEYPGIFEASFRCEECKDGSEVKKLFFLKKNESSDWEEPAIKFSINEGPLISPHCMVLHKTYGFIDKVSFGDDEVSYVELSPTRTKGNFKLWSTYVEYTKKKDVNGTLFCVYKIPGSSIRMTQPYYGYSDDDIVEVNNTFVYPGDPDYSSIRSSTQKFKDMVDRERKLELEKQRKRQLAILLATTIPSGVAMIVLMILAVIYRKAIYHKIWEVILSLRYPKVYKYWRFLKGFDFRYMDKLIEDTKYMPKKAPKKESSETSDSSDMGVELDLSIYDSTLIKPQDGTSKYGFRAHEIFHYLQKRRYIISENPKLNDVYDFWSMIKNEGVKAIVAITYENDYDPNGSYIPYWPAVINFFGDITVRNFGVSNMSVPIARAFRLELTQGDSEDIEHIFLYVVHGWKHGSTAMSPGHLVELYNSVSLAAGGGTVLVHSRVEPVSGVFVFTYFAAIVEILEKGRNVKNEDEWNGMMIIKKIKDQIPSIPLSGMEVAYLLVAIVDYFVKREILLNGHKVASFYYKFQDYLHNIRKKKVPHTIHTN